MHLKGYGPIGDMVERYSIGIEGPVEGGPVS